jgi:hypothetical protein
MPQASAFLPPQTVPSVPAQAPRNLWILSSWRDLLLYVGTPLLLVPMFALAQSHWSAQDIYLFVGAFGATGHHLPGMIRAYGDRALFERFKWRFIFAPIFLASVCVLFYLYDLKGIMLVLFFWGVWHGMMQTFGFVREGQLGKAISEYTEAARLAPGDASINENLRRAQELHDNGQAVR